MNSWRGIALLGALMVSATCRAEAVDQRIYDLSIRGDATPHWLETPKISHLLTTTDNRWSLQRARSKRLQVSTGAWGASFYVVRPHKGDGLSAGQPVPGRLSAVAAGADLAFRVADGFSLLTRAAAMQERTRPYFDGFRARGVKTERMMIGAGVESPGNALLIVDYVRVEGKRNVNRLIDANGASPLGSGARLTLAGSAPVAGQAGWTLTAMSMRRPDVRYGNAIVTPSMQDRRVEFGMHFGL